MARKAKIEEISNRFERKRSGRKINTRKERTYFLIVCGGKATEKLYFDAFKKKLPVNAIQIETKPDGRDPVRVTDTAIRLKNAPTTIKYDEVWVVFDKDFFDNFDEAIRKAGENDIYCAWSNIAFELWYALHFRDIESKLSQKECETCIEKGVRTKLKGYKYNKTAVDMYEILEKHGNQAEAIERAKELTENCRGHNYTNYNPCTTVYKLVEKLNEYLT